MRPRSGWYERISRLLWGSFCQVHHLSWWSLVHNGYWCLILLTYPGVELVHCTFLPHSPAEKPTFTGWRAKSHSEEFHFLWVSELHLRRSSRSFTSMVSKQVKCKLLTLPLFHFPSFQLYQCRWIFINFIVVLKTTAFDFW